MPPKFHHIQFFKNKIEKSSQILISTLAPKWAIGPQQNGLLGHNKMGLGPQKPSPLFLFLHSPLSPPRLRRRRHSTGDNHRSLPPSKSPSPPPSTIRFLVIGFSHGVIIIEGSSKISF